MGPHAQVPSGLPNSAELSLNYGAHDATYGHENATYQPFIAAGSRQFPEITSYAPIQGPAGRKLVLYLNAAEDLSPYFFVIGFGNKRVDALVSKLAQDNQHFNHILDAEVPAFDSTGCSSTQIPLFLYMSDASHNFGMPLEFGHFTYTDATAYNMSSPSHDMSRKRKLSADLGGQSPGKRQSSGQLRTGEISPRSNNTLSPFSQTQQASNYAYSHTPTRSQYQPLGQPSLATPRYGTSPNTTATQLGMGAAQQASTYSPYGYSAAPASASMLTQTPISSGASGSSNPTLVRTSALTGEPGASPMGTSPFNPYAMYPSNAKAVLKLDGNLMSMVEHWTAEEVAVERRLVRFRRSQSGSTINATFEPVTPEDHARAPGNIYVNCIWWKEKQECFITSVDTIQLLESLVAVRFTVEEKNRIRRNLEGFRPMTVSKTRPECEEFFKLIMGFPSPKPRNIEKDVKVFPWRILAHALKKIISKYVSFLPSVCPCCLLTVDQSASYSSTAGAIHSSHSASASSGSNSLERPTVSPPSAGSSAGAMQYSSSMPSTNMSPHLGHGHHVGLAGTQGPADMRVGVPGPLNNMPQSISWHQPSANYTTEMSQPRASWDFSAFVDSNPNSAGGNYNRIPSISQSLGYPQYYMQPSEYKDYNQRTTQA